MSDLVELVVEKELMPGLELAGAPPWLAHILEKRGKKSK